MAKFEDHILQARKNINFLSAINNNVPDCLDWQVTTCFYTALHLVNAHLSKHDMQYRKHVDVKDALNPEKQLSLTKIDEAYYISYISLQSLSRRARYLVEEGDRNLESTDAFLIYEKHLAKAFRHLDKLLGYFSTKYSLSFPKVEIKCDNIQYDELKHFLRK